MSRHDELIKELEDEHKKTKIPDFHVGDTLKVSTKIIEGEKERIQIFQGTVIARTGKGLSETFSLHRVSYDEGMERVFCLHSPRIAKLEVVRKGNVRRSKLYHLRGKTGKAAKIQEKIIGKRASKKQVEPLIPKDVDQKKPSVKPEPKAVKVEPQDDHDHIEQEVEKTEAK